MSSQRRLPPPEQPAIPIAQESERALIGAVLSYPAAIATAALTLSPGHFSSPLCQAVYGAALVLHGDDVAPDPVSVEALLSARNGHAGPAHDLAAIVDLVDHACLPIQVEHHAQLVAQAAERRRLLQVADSLRSMAQDPNTDPGEASALAATKLVVTGQTDESGGTTRKTFLELLDEGVSAGPRRVFSTGFDRLDQLLTGRGLLAGTLAVVLAPPAGGKSYFLLAMAQAAARAAPCLYISAELSRRDMLDRALAKQLRRPLQDVMFHVGWNGEESRQAVARDPLQVVIIRRAHAEQTHPLAIIRHHARQLARETGRTPVIFIDYLQRLVEMTSSDRDRFKATADLAYALVDFAEELDTAVITIAAMNRAGVEKGRKAKGTEEANDPQLYMGAARDSSAIESAAAVQLVLDLGKPTSDGSRPARLGFVKRRHGGGDDWVGFRFSGRHGLYEPDESVLDAFGRFKAGADEAALEGRIMEALKARPGQPILVDQLVKLVPGKNADKRAWIKSLVAAGTIGSREAPAGPKGGRPGLLVWFPPHEGGNLNLRGVS